MESIENRCSSHRILLVIPEHLLERCLVQGVGLHRLLLQLLLLALLGEKPLLLPPVCCEVGAHGLGDLELSAVGRRGLGSGGRGGCGCCCASARRLSVGVGQALPDVAARAAAAAAGVDAAAGRSDGVGAGGSRGRRRLLLPVSHLTQYLRRHDLHDVLEDPPGWGGGLGNAARRAVHPPAEAAGLGGRGGRASF